MTQSSDNSTGPDPNILGAQYRLAPEGRAKLKKYFPRIDTRRFRAVVLAEFSYAGREWVAIGHPDRKRQPPSTMQRDIFVEFFVAVNRSERTLNTKKARTSNPDLVS